MFERYTEKAQRMIFFARYEASQYGSPYIETEHLLLGVLRESNVLAKLVIGSQSNIEAVRKAIEARIVHERVSAAAVIVIAFSATRRQVG